MPLCVWFATSLIEAGVDVDFPVVWRAHAGLESIIQAAGRCNRNGRVPQGDVFVFEPAEGEGRNPPPEIEPVRGGGPRRDAALRRSDIRGRDQALLRATLLDQGGQAARSADVAPRAGAWIETAAMVAVSRAVWLSPPRAGGVD